MAAEDEPATGDDAAAQAAPAPSQNPAPSQDDGGTRRTDAAGYDVKPPPTQGQPAGQNPGLATESAPEKMDFREIDSGAQWTFDTPAPDRQEAAANPAAAEGVSLPLGDDPREQTSLGAQAGDLIEDVTTAIEETELLDLWDITVERVGDVVILRGSAATPEDRDRAAELAGAVRGVGRVENLISAGRAHGA